MHVTTQVMHIYQTNKVACVCRPRTNTVTINDTFESGEMFHVKHHTVVRLRQVRRPKDQKLSCVDSYTCCQQVDEIIDYNHECCYVK